MDRSSFSVASLVALLILFGNFVDGATLFSQLTDSLTVSVTGAQNASPNGTRAGTDELFVRWGLSSSAAVDDSTYRTVELRLCFGAPSQVDRAWRKTNDILSKDKACLYRIASLQPYTRGGNTTVWLVGKEIPFAHYFVRAYVLDSSGEKIAYGQTSNAQRTSNLFTIEPISGRHTSIDIAAGVFSAFSVLSLFGFFFYEKMSKGRKS